METSTLDFQRERSALQLGNANRAACALEEAIFEFCEVAFAPYANADLYDALVSEQFEDPDLTSVHDLCIHLYRHRAQVTSRFRDALLKVDFEKAMHFACAEDTSCSSASTLHRAACGMRRRKQAELPFESSNRDRALAYTATLNFTDEDGLLLLSAAVLDTLEVFFPAQSEVDTPTLALFLLVLRKSLSADPGIAKAITVYNA